MRLVLKEGTVVLEDLLRLSSFAGDRRAFQVAVALRAVLGLVEGPKAKVGKALEGRAKTASGTSPLLQQTQSLSRQWPLLEGMRGAVSSEEKLLSRHTSSRDDRGSRRDQGRREDDDRRDRDRDRDRDRHHSSRSHREEDRYGKRGREEDDYEDGRYGRRDERTSSSHRSRGSRRHR
ncbi:hypothetical protein ADEAN_000484000 [Angomonas deanei]|uniref:Uncharacterized protein n=1 Tax=Angomonas deanei TaxID=59799 RepID=A0A7G2CGQ2_9TRYP|nr:hypothetical protein ADEAN_000484000 [Angomonas deanei]